MASANTQKVNERLALAEQAAAQGNMAAAVAYAKAALGFSKSDASTANINKIIAAYSGSGQQVAPQQSPQSAPQQGVTTPTTTTVDNTADRQAASAWLSSVLSSYGLGSLAGNVDSLVQQWGTNSNVIALKLKDTSEYKTRFAGLLALQQRGVTDIQNEAQYINLESQYRAAFRENGLSGFLGAAGSSTELSKIADLVGKYSLSVNEVRDRISDAQRVAANTSPEVRDSFERYYGITSDQLVAYSLDPQGTADRMNRQANAAIAGGMATKASLNIGQTVGEQIADLAGTGDINQGDLSGRLQDAYAVKDATARLAQIEGSSLADDTIVQSTLGLDANAQKRVSTLQSRERARFSGTSGVNSGTLSRSSGA